MPEPGLLKQTTELREENIQVIRAAKDAGAVHRRASQQTKVNRSFLILGMKPATLGGTPYTIDGRGLQ